MPTLKGRFTYNNTTKELAFLSDRGSICIACRGIDRKWNATAPNTAKGKFATLWDALDWLEREEMK